MVRDIVVRRLRAADGRGRRAPRRVVVRDPRRPWIGFRQSVFRRYAEIKTAKPVSPMTASHEYNPGEVWEENEFWIDLIVEDRP